MKRLLLIISLLSSKITYLSKQSIYVGMFEDEIKAGESYFSDTYKEKCICGAVGKITVFTFKCASKNLYLLAHSLSKFEVDYQKISSQNPPDQTYRSARQSIA